MTQERECGLLLIARVNGVKKVFMCDPSKGCLQDLVWNGNGINGAAAQKFEVPESSISEAYLDGDFASCVKLVTLKK